MSELFPVKVDFTKKEIQERQLSKQEVRERFEKMLEKYPDDVIFDTVYVVSCFGVLKSNGCNLDDDNGASLTHRLG